MGEGFGMDINSCCWPGMGEQLGVDINFCFRPIVTWGENGSYCRTRKLTVEKATWE